MLNKDLRKIIKKLIIKTEKNYDQKGIIEYMQWFSFQDIIFCTANNNKSLAKHLQKLLKVF